MFLKYKINGIKYYLWLHFLFFEKFKGKKEVDKMEKWIEKKEEGIN